MPSIFDVAFGGRAQTMKTNPRVQAIRSRVQNERERISELTGKISTDLKNLLKPASDGLDDLENFYLDDAILQGARTEDQLERWLDRADLLLRRAAHVREHTERLVQKYGIARVFGAQ
jgi:hypothetical protein